MSIRIFGSGGGGVITDATATPDVVREGEVFYNNDGRQVGTNPNVKSLCTEIVQYTNGTHTPVSRSVETLLKQSTVNGRLRAYTLAKTSSGYLDISHYISETRDVYYGFIIRHYFLSANKSDIQTITVNNTSMDYTIHNGSSELDLYNLNVGNGSIILAGNPYNGNVYPVLESGNAKLTGIYLVLFVRFVVPAKGKIGNMTVQDSKPITVKYWK